MPLAVLDGGAVPLTRDLCNLFARPVSRGDDLALISHSQSQALLLRQSEQTPSGIPCLKWTYRQLDDTAERLASVLSSSYGDKPATTAIFTWNRAEWALFLWACAKSRSTFVPLDPRIAFRNEEASHILGLVQPKVIVVENISGAYAIDAILSGGGYYLGGSPLKILLDPQEESALSGWTLLSNALLQANPNTHTEPRHISRHETHGSPTDIGAVIFTSGTTGQPKGCPHTVQGIGSQSNLYQSSRRLSSDSKCIIHTPCFRALGLSWSICCWRAGGTVVFPAPSFDAGKILEAIHEHRCTHMSGSPSNVHDIVRHEEYTRLKPQSLRLLSLSGDVIMNTSLDFAKQALCAEVATSAFGMSEGTGVLGWSKDSMATPDMNGFLPVGTALPGCKLRIQDPITGETLLRGQPGELHFSGPSFIRQYLGNHQPESFYEDGEDKWFISGDRALVDTRGRVFILGRYKDVIMREGVGLSPALIENILRSLPGVVEV